MVGVVVIKGLTRIIFLVIENAKYYDNPMSDRIIFWGVVFCGLLPFFVDTPKACVERGGWDHAEGVVQRTAMRAGPVAWLWLGCGLVVACGCGLWLVVVACLCLWLGCGLLVFVAWLWRWFPCIAALLQFLLVLLYCSFAAIPISIANHPCHLVEGKALLSCYFASVVVVLPRGKH